ncbi:hypothetical protein HPB52_000074 [Rhipicephalus sanguineus]|uniref:Piwi domain-containing protein n=1 Tax=Rhipicephalus sanguineus TaxID=34632 RepID=A0A9D4SVD1_RHISA|nr:hypothetical protein HPB52_000074 [Rhipicephalus sanguineus]
MDDNVKTDSSDRNAGAAWVARSGKVPAELQPVWQSWISSGTISLHTNYFHIKSKSAAFKECSLVFDGKKNIYTVKEVSSQEVTYSVNIGEKSKQDFAVTLKPAPNIDMDELKNRFDPGVHQKHIQALDIIIRHAARQSHESVGRYFFKAPENHTLNDSKTFAVLAVDCEIDAGKIGTELKNACNELGITLCGDDSKSISTKDKDPLSEATTAFRDLGEKDLVLVVLGNAGLYAAVKAAADVRVGVLTQCVQEKSLTRHRLWRNICLKINAKLGGCNNILCKTWSERIFKDAIVIGIDVNHPAPGDNHTPSIAACVASMDDYAFKYHARVAVQMDGDQAVARKEVVMKLQDMVLNLLRSSMDYRRKRRRPQRIIVYRDGVSEGQFKEVKAKEVEAIRSACRQIHRAYNPSVTFIIVQKRHHTRFLPVHEGQPVDLNVPPGTTIDNVVTHPENTNFFLCSHQGLLGTSRPAHYHVLCNDSGDKPNELQQLTYDLCHLVARCTRSVSTPAPVYYAHLAAFRAKNHIEGSRLDRSASAQQYKDAVQVHEEIANKMYFV